MWFIVGTLTHIASVHPLEFLKTEISHTCRQLYLLNQIPTKILDTKVLASCYDWQYFILVYSCASVLWEVRIVCITSLGGEKCTLCLWSLPCVLCAPCLISALHWAVTATIEEFCRSLASCQFWRWIQRPLNLQLIRSEQSWGFPTFATPVYKLLSWLGRH